jgi:hypothetical protein
MSVHPDVAKLAPVKEGGLYTCHMSELDVAEVPVTKRQKAWFTAQYRVSKRLR